jgi:hypothetical protein
VVGTRREKKGGRKTIFEEYSCTLANILCPKITKKETEIKTDENQDSHFIGGAKKDFYV